MMFLSEYKQYGPNGEFVIESHWDNLKSSLDEFELAHIFENPHVQKMLDLKNETVQHATIMQQQNQYIIPTAEIANRPRFTGGGISGYREY
jgi:hypothetical protein